MEWTDEEKQQVLENVLASTRNNKGSFQSTLGKLDWDTLKLESRTASECKALFTTMTNKIRRFRTMEEVVTDAKVSINDPTKHSDYPKKPSNAYSLFVSKKSKKMLKDKIAFKDIMISLSETWKKMSEEEKQPYVTKAQEKNEEWRLELEKFKQKHSSLYLEKPQAPFPHNIYADAKVEEILEENPELQYKKAHAKAVQKYQELKDSKKLRWIRKAVSKVPDYQEKSKAYAENSKDKKVKIVTKFLSKTEQMLWEKDLGKPEPVSANLYKFYLSRDINKMDLPQIEFEAVMRTRFRGLSNEEKEKIKKEQEDALKSYNYKFKLFYKSLSDEHKALISPPKEDENHEGKNGRLSEEEDSQKKKEKSSNKRKQKADPPAVKSKKAKVSDDSDNEPNKTVGSEAPDSADDSKVGILESIDWGVKTECPSVDSEQSSPEKKKKKKKKNKKSGETSVTTIDDSLLSLA